MITFHCFNTLINSGREVMPLATSSTPSSCRLTMPSLRAAWRKRSILGLVAIILRVLSPTVNNSKIAVRP